MQKPKEWVRITSGPSYKFATTHMMLLKGPAQLPCLLHFALVSLCLACSVQPYLALNTSTTNNTATIPTLSNPNNSTHYYFLN